MIRCTHTHSGREYGHANKSTILGKTEYQTLHKGLSQILGKTHLTINTFENKYVNVMGLLFPQIFEALLMKDTSLLGNRSG